MKAEFLVENIENYISILSKILPIHSQIPILANILIETTKEGIFISSTNLETGVKIKIPGKVMEEGATTIPGKQFLEALSSLPKDKIEISLEKDSFKLASRGNSIVFQTISKEEFPSIFEKKGEKVASFSEKELEDVFKGLIFAASLDESRPEITGVLLSQNDTGVDFVATDGFRLSLKKMNGKKMGDLESLILPAKVIGEALSLKEGVSLFIYEAANQVIFETENVVLVGRFISGKYPNYEKVIPKATSTSILIDAEDLSQKLKIVSIFARETANMVRIKIEDGKVILRAAASGVGEGEAEVEGKQEGESGEIAFNIKFLSDFLKNASGQISMSVSSAVEPALFKVDSDPDYLHVIMPVRVDN